MSLHYVKQQRPITDALRRSVVEDLPELADIGKAQGDRSVASAQGLLIPASPRPNHAE